MFKVALQKLNGRIFGYSGLTRELKKIRFQHIEDIPPELDTDELFLLALRSKWLTETQTGRFKVRIID